MSFRSKVHDALNIVKGSVKLPIDEVLLGKQYVESKSKDFDAAVCIANTPAQYDIGGGHCQWVSLYYQLLLQLFRTRVV